MICGKQRTCRLNLSRSWLYLCLNVEHDTPPQMGDRRNRTTGRKHGEIKESTTDAILVGEVRRYRLVRRRAMLAMSPVRTVCDQPQPLLNAMGHDQCFPVDVGFFDGLYGRCSDAIPATVTQRICT